MASEVIDLAFSGLQARSAIFSQAVLRPPWGVQSGPLGKSIYHVVLEGTAWVSLTRGGPEHLLERGDVVLLPHGADHTLRSEPGAPTVLLADLPKDPSTPACPTVFGGQGDATHCRLACGSIGLEPLARELLMAGLPDLVIARAPAMAAWVRATLESLLGEMRSTAVGTPAVVNRLAEVLVIQILRHVGATVGAGLPAIAPDSGLGRLLKAFWADPSANWSVAQMCRVAACSRTALHNRFMRLLGMPPASFVRWWRLQLALNALRAGSTVEEASERTGYASANALGQAFRQQLGHSPTACLAPQFRASMPAR